MGASELADIVGNANAVSDIWDQALDQIQAIAGPNGEKLDIGRNLPSVSPPMSLMRLDSVLAAATALVGTLSTVENVLAVPAALVTELGSRIAEVKTHVERMKAELDGLLSAGPIAAIDSSSVTVQGAGGRAVNLAQHLQSISNPLQTVLSNAQLIRLRSSPVLAG